MELTVITEGLPDELTTQLFSDEDVHYLSFISYKRVSSKSSVKEDFWIAITSKRVIYRTKVLVNSKSVEKEGILPIDKISFIEVTEITDNQGCGCSSPKKAFELRISTSGGVIEMPLPAKEKGDEIKNVFQSVADKN